MPMRLAVMGTRRVGGVAAGKAAAADAVLDVLDADAFFGTLREVDHARAVQGDDGFLGIVVEVLADDEDGLAVAVAVGVGEGDVGGERNVAGHAASRDSGTRRGCTRRYSRRS